MGIETWHLNHDKRNPAWRAVEGLRKWCEKENVGLHPNTIKPFTSLDQIVERTVLGRVFPMTSTGWDYLTPNEVKIISDPINTSQITKVALVDIDGPVIENILPTLKEFWHCQSHNLGTLRACIEKTRPSWTTLLPLGDIARRVDKLILWTSRFAPRGDSLIWEQAKPLFGDLGSFDAFPFLSQPTIQKIEEQFFPGRTQVIAGKIKGLGQSGFDEITRTIEELKDPYIVYVGSSLFDIERFKNLINFLRVREMPFDQAVFCTNVHWAL